MEESEDHRHCKVCGRVTAVDEEFCSAACRRKREAAMASRRTYLYLFYGLMAFVILIVLLSYVRI